MVSVCRVCVSWFAICTLTALHPRLAAVDSDKLVVEYVKRGTVGGRATIKDIVAHLRVEERRNALHVALEDANLLTDSQYQTGPITSAYLTSGSVDDRATLAAAVQEVYAKAIVDSRRARVVRALEPAGFFAAKLQVPWADSGATTAFVHRGEGTVASATAAPLAMLKTFQAINKALKSAAPTASDVHAMPPPGAWRGLWHDCVVRDAVSVQVVVDAVVAHHQALQAAADQLAAAGIIFPSSLQRLATAARTLFMAGGVSVIKGSRSPDYHESWTPLVKAVNTMPCNPAAVRAAATDQLRLMERCRAAAKSILAMEPPLDKMYHSATLKRLLEAVHIRVLDRLNAWFFRFHLHEQNEAVDAAVEDVVRVAINTTSTMADVSAAVTRFAQASCSLRYSRFIEPVKRRAAAVFMADAPEFQRFVPLFQSQDTIIPALSSASSVVSAAEARKAKLLASLEKDVPLECAPSRASFTGWAAGMAFVRYGAGDVDAVARNRVRHFMRAKQAVVAPAVALFAGPELEKPPFLRALHAKMTRLDTMPGDTVTFPAGAPAVWHRLAAQASLGADPGQDGAVLGQLREVVARCGQLVDGVPAERKPKAWQTLSAAIAGSDPALASIVQFLETGNDQTSAAAAVLRRCDQQSGDHC